MSVPNSYNGIRQILPEGVTLTSGTFLGFVNGGTAQTIKIGGNLIYAGITKSVDGVTFYAAAGQEVKVDCTHLKPAQFPIISYF